MKKLVSFAIMLTMAICICQSKNIVNAKIGPYYTLEDVVFGKKYTIDSLVVSGTPSEADYATMRDMINNGNLRGIDMSGVSLDYIPERAFASTKINSAESRTEGESSLLMRLDYITLSKDLRNIGDMAFTMTSLKCIRVPRVMSVGYKAFAGCQELREVKMCQPGVPTTYADAFKGLPDDAVLIVPIGSMERFKSAAEYTGFKRIEESEDVFKIRSFTLGEGLPSLQECLTDEMFSVDSLTLKGTVSEADFVPMRIGCVLGELSGIDLSGCKLENDMIPHDAFVLTEGDPYFPTDDPVLLLKSPYYLRQIKLPEGVKTIGECAFQYSGPISVQIPSTVREIGAEAFYKSEIDGDIVIPEGLTHLELNTFCYATVNGDVYLPSTLESADALCLSFVRKADSTLKIYYNRMTPPKVTPQMSHGIFGANKIPYGWTLYVPVGAKAAFAADELDWGRFSNIIETPDLDGGLGDGINAAVLDNESTDSRIFTLDGRYAGKSLDALQSGIYVVNGKKILK